VRLEFSLYRKKGFFDYVNLGSYEIMMLLEANFSFKFVSMKKLAVLYKLVNSSYLIFMSEEDLILERF